MGLFDFGNDKEEGKTVSEVSIDVERECARLLTAGETVVKIYTLKRGSYLVATDKRLMNLEVVPVNSSMNAYYEQKKGLNYTSVPYRSIVKYTIGTEDDLIYNGYLSLIVGFGHLEENGKVVYKYDKKKNPECDVDIFALQKIVAEHVI